MYFIYGIYSRSNRERKVIITTAIDNNSLYHFAAIYSRSNAVIIVYGNIPEINANQFNLIPFYFSRFPPYANIIKIIPKIPTIFPKGEW